jgi:carbon-monoxide dehydrogenase large subunit
MRRCSPGQYAIPAIHANVRAVYTNTVAGRCLSRCRAAGGDLSPRAHDGDGGRELGVSPAELRRKNFIRTFPYQTPVIMNYDAGDYEASLECRHAGRRLGRLRRAPARRKAAACAAASA